MEVLNLQWKIWTGMSGHVKKMDDAGALLLVLGSRSARDLKYPLNIPVCTVAYDTVHTTALFGKLTKSD
jgi:hypothetical protein